MVCIKFQEFEPVESQPILYYLSNAIFKVEVHFAYRATNLQALNTIILKWRETQIVSTD